MLHRLRIRLTLSSLRSKGFSFSALVLSAALFLTGCEKPASPSNSSSGEAPDPTMPQPKLQTMKLWVGSEELNAELALSHEQQRIGMMLRTNLNEDAGMFFP